MVINHEDFVTQWLQDSENQNSFLHESILEYIQDGDYSEFYHSLEQVIKARGSIKQFAEQVGLDRSNLTDLLHGKNKNAPNMQTVLKILNGLGYEILLRKKKTA